MAALNPKPPDLGGLISRRPVAKFAILLEEPEFVVSKLKKE